MIIRFWRGFNRVNSGLNEGLFGGLRMYVDRKNPAEAGFERNQAISLAAETEPAEEPG